MSILKGYKCRTVEEALQVLSENRGNAKVVSGGTAALFPALEIKP